MMERLTTRINDHVYYTKGKYPNSTTIAEMEKDEIRECMRKLAMYEDREEDAEECLEETSSSDALKVVRCHHDNLAKYLNKLKGSVITSVLPCFAGGSEYFYTIVYQSHLTLEDGK